MSKTWQNVGALMIAAGYFICLMWSSVNFSFHGHVSFAYGGSLQGGLLTFVAVMVAWFGVRDGQKWSWWTLLIGLLAVAVARIAVDRSCSVKIFWQHGCHQFMIGSVLAAIGFVLTRD